MKKTYFLAWIFCCIPLGMAEIGDEDSVKDALLISGIVKNDADRDYQVTLDWSAFAGQWSQVNQHLAAKNVHPLLRFIAACVSSANQDLINLASFIKASYVKDKDFIYTVFGLRWRSTEGSEEEKNIYKIVEFGEKKQASGEAILNSRALSLMMQYKVLGTRSTKEALADYVSYIDVRPYEAWIDTLWPDFFEAEDRKKIPHNFLLQTERALGEGTKAYNLIYGNLSVFYPVIQKANPDIFWEAYSVCQDSFVEQILSLEDEFEKASLIEEEREKQERAESQKRKELELEEDLAYKKWYTEMVLAKSAREEEVRKSKEVAEEAKRKAALPPSYNVLAGSVNSSDKAKSICTLAAIQSARYLLARPLARPDMVINGWVNDAAKEYEKWVMSGVDSLSVSKALEGKNDIQNIGKRGFNAVEGAFSIDAVIDDLTSNKKPTAAVITRSSMSVALVWREGKLYFFNSHGEPSKVNDAFGDKYKNAFIAVFDTVDDAKRALPAFAPFGVTEAAECTFLQLP